MSRDLSIEREVAFSSLKQPKKRIMNMSARDPRFIMAEPSCYESCKSQLDGCFLCFDYFKRWRAGEFK